VSHRRSFVGPEFPSRGRIAAPRPNNAEESDSDGGCDGRLVGGTTNDVLEFRGVGRCYRLWAVDLRQDPWALKRS
jgi:hypothetical protein